MDKIGVTIFDDWVWAGENHGVWILKNLADYVPSMDNKKWLVKLSLEVTERTTEIGSGDGDETISFLAREYNDNYKEKTPIFESFNSTTKSEFWITTDADAMIEIYFDFNINEERKRKAKIVLEDTLD